jgi:putative peptide zinc metalloprotease protein
MALPALREELALLPGPVLSDGQPSHTLHDPVRNLFFQIDWPTFEVLRRWHLGSMASIAESVSAQTTLQLERSDVDGIQTFLRDNQLLRPAPGAGGAAALAARLRTRRGSIWQQLLHNYLFFRVPLVKPDRWLGRWAPHVGFFYSRRFLLLTLAALCWGLVEVFRQWERFTGTLVDTFSVAGLVSYGFTLVGVKVLHELGHAFTAKRLGCKVPTMGIAFLVMWPVAYTDTNEVWKLTARRQRLAVVAAGVLTELAVAAWATLAWALLPEGLPKSMAFLLATTTLLTTLVVNASPFMRFDGYFLLSDWLGMPNLHARAFALARWHLRETLLAWGAPAPEALPARRRAGLILFAYATWVYRLVVFLGIAALVYAFFIKAVGILLFMVEIGWFVLLPLYRELAIWRAHWPALKKRPRARRSLAVLAALALIGFMPWPTRLTASALLRPEAQFVVYAPPHAQVVALPIAEGQRVEAGTVLMQLDSPDLASQRARAAARASRLRWQAASATFNGEQRTQWLLTQQQLDTAEAEVAALEADAERYRPAAPFAGVLRDLAPDLRPGAWLGAREPLARLVDDRGGPLVVAYLNEDDLARVSAGDGARFYADSPQGPSVALRVERIDTDASRVLAEPELSSLFGGSVAVREKDGRFHPERPVYRVTLVATDAAAAATPLSAQHTWRGTVVVSGRWAAPGWHYLRGALAVLRREAGF